eukprot:3364060-Prymnesium_polylepis.1
MAFTPALCICHHFSTVLESWHSVSGMESPESMEILRPASRSVWRRVFGAVLEGELFCSSQSASRDTCSATY